MKDIFLFNTLSKQKEKFIPIEEGKVSMYHCGPTVYDYAHIGNLRSYVFADTLRRLFEWHNYKVKQIINITDIGHLSSDADQGEDKMTKALKREGRPFTLSAMREVADFYFEKFKIDLKYLNIKTPSEFPFASDHIEEDKELIETLIKKGFTYKTKDGLYFDTSKDFHYGKLGNIAKNDESRPRIVVNDEKKDFRDFALWKFNDMGYDTTFGKGFPGWHIECSAMSMKYLGETFDIHTGGIDHIPIHHNNEIAQSENATGKAFVHFWMHNAFVIVNEDKMAKSANNFTRLIDLIEKGYSPIAYRMLLLQSHYRSPMNFSLEALSGAKEALYGIYRMLSELSSGGNMENSWIKKFEETINDDLNTPRAVAVLFELLKSDVDSKNKLTTALKFDEVLGLGIKENITLLKKETEEIPIIIKNLVAEREVARKNKRFDKADILRQEIGDLGYIVEDLESGPKVYKK
ncbi:MAG: cysteine--tRNA ligase [Patescibacteria group bacterium]